MSAVETGVYITLIATMYERGEPIAEDHSRLARLCGASNSAFKKALETLLHEGKIVRVDAGLWNDRVEKEQVYLSEKSEVGSRAANARWTKKNKENKADDDADALRGHCDGNANQKPDTRIYTVPDGTDATASDQIDFRELLWRDGLLSLKRQTGKTDSGARQLIGKWCRSAKDDCRLVFQKISQAEYERIGDPIPWITQAVAMATAPPAREPDLADLFNARAREARDYDDGRTIEGSHDGGDFHGSRQALPRPAAPQGEPVGARRVVPDRLPQSDETRDRDGGGEVDPRRAGQALEIIRSVAGGAFSGDP